MQRFESRIVCKDGLEVMGTHKSLAAARKYCRQRYSMDDGIDWWQVIEILEDGRRRHYTQDVYERR